MKSIFKFRKGELGCLLLIAFFNAMFYVREGRGWEDLLLRLFVSYLFIFAGYVVGAVFTLVKAKERLSATNLDALPDK